MDVKNNCLCSWSSEQLEGNIEDFKNLVREPGFICKGCGRASSVEKTLCDSVPLNSLK
jgi:hypothetical protein